jgi:glucose-6-phosphate-specific signal transduction histidine kinase
MAAPDLSEREAAFAEVLGKAIIHVWADLSQAVQEKLFEQAVVAGHCSERDESLREELARFLHNHHSRTTHAQER